MNIRVKAALYAIGFFVGIFVLASVLNAIIPYLQPWMGWTALFGFLFYLVYSLMLTNLQFDDSISKSIENLNKVIDKESTK
jgi:multisubunit Na+/H+ antiporter MnhE subunit